jgi:PAS domain S-box-containing protein
LGGEKDAQILPRGIGAVETQWRRRDGAVVDVLLSSSPMDPAALHENVVLISLDIAVLHEKEAALRESEARFRRFMDNSPAIAWIKDEQGRHAYLNRTYPDLFGVRPEDRFGKTDLELWPPEVVRQFQENDRIMMTTGRAIQVTEETRLPTAGSPPGGTSRSLSWTRAGGCISAASASTSPSGWRPRRD